MQISLRGLSLTENSEGCRLTSYQDTGGVWTIGYGHTRNVGPGQKITQDQAATLLQADMQAATVVVNNHCLPCTQGQFDALADFVFNVGAVQFLSSHLFAYHKAREYDKAADEFPKWKYDNGKVEQGLVTRRAAEKALYTLQEPVEVHQHIDGPEHSAVSAPDPAPVVSSGESNQPLPVLPVPASLVAQASGNTLSVFLSQASESFRSLIAGIGKTKD